MTYHDTGIKESITNPAPMGIITENIIDLRNISIKFSALIPRDISQLVRVKIKLHFLFKF
jgi:hypothetical protein